MADTYAAFIAKLDEISPAIAKAFREAVEDITSATQLRALQAAIERGDVEGAVAAINLGPAFFAPLDQAVADSFRSGAIWQLAQTLPKSGSLAGRLQIRFDGRHQRAETWTRRQGARLVTEVAESVKEAVRLTVRDGLQAGRKPRAVALDIVGRTNRATGRREGGILGLTSQQAGYVVNARREIEELDGSYFQRKLRDKRFDGTVSKAIKDGKPLSKADVDRIIARYSDRLLKHRGDVIGRTEALTALNAGRHEGMQQLADDPAIPRAAVKREWISTPDSRTRDSHATMSRQKVGLDEPFTTPEGHRMMFPGDNSLGAPASETIQCRCSFRSAVDWQAVAEAAT